MHEVPANDPHGPHAITLECPVDCLKAVLSLQTLNPLARAYEAPFDPPETVGDVLKLYREHQLGQITGLGRRRIGEIEVGLVFAGFTSEHTPSA
jgi:hypothetical protein